MMKTAVVTGASSGIGREFVRQIAGKYSWLDEIWIIARRAKELEKLKDLLEKEKPEILFLVNAAGMGVQKEFAGTSLKDVVSMTELNCTALTGITSLCLPYCRERGRIFMLASAAAFIPQPGFGVYAASKAYVVSFSRALNRELKCRKIQVTAVCPGPGSKAGRGW